MRSTVNSHNVLSFKMRASTRLLLPLSLVALAQAKVHQVSVGKDGELKFDPETVKAEIGDFVQYNFFSKNHSVTESSFEQPCLPLTDGFFSGFVSAESEDDPSTTTFTVKVEDDKPTWVYCAQGNHCQKGMLHAINSPEKGNTFDDFKTAAKDQPKTGSPDDGLPKGGNRRVTVEVGKDGKTFAPQNIVEPKGTIVHFNFNPKNHSVSQSSFDKPCEPLKDGFSSGFIPLGDTSPSVVYDYTISDDKPIWFYCGQQNGDHCQSGMVGSVNAPNTGNTLEAFIANAKKAKTPSTIPAEAPLGGTLTIDGTKIEDKAFKGAVWPDSSSSSTNSPTSTNTYVPSKTPPPPGPDTPPEYTQLAGGGKPVHWNWATNLTTSATSQLQLHNRIEDILLNLLEYNHGALSPNGPYAGTYPPAILDMIGAWAAQSLIHRATTAEILVHYNRTVPGRCQYNVVWNVEEFLAKLARLNSVQIGVLIDISAKLAKEDPFLIPVLMTQVGAKSRTAGVVNMMRNHMAAAAPREVALPAKLAWSYVMRTFVGDCPDKIEGMPDKAWPGLDIVTKKEEGERTVSVEVSFDGKTEGAKGELYAVWLGQYGVLEFTDIEEDGKTVIVPAGLYGDVWLAIVDSEGLKLDELDAHMVAGPTMVWVNEP